MYNTLMATKGAWWKAALWGWVVIASVGLTACAGGEGVPTGEVDIPDKGAPATVPHTPTPLASINEAPRFMLYSQEPVLGRGERGWDKMYVHATAVAAQGELLHMFYGGVSGEPDRDNPQLGSIGYAISLDGYEWHRFSEQPLRFEGGMLADLAYMNATSVFVDEDGSWVMYFSAAWAEGEPIGQSFIGRAAAEKPEGPWTLDEEPVLLPGGPTRWDGGGIYDPKVFQMEDGFRMYYVGMSGDTDQFGPAQIGLATSEDGITWTKFDDPGTNEPLYGNSDPVFRTGEEGAWDASLVENAQIMRTQEGWAMLYRGTNLHAEAGPQLGYATSQDGITWEREASNPILTLDGFLEDHNIWQVVWLFYEGQHFLYLSGYEHSIGVGHVFLALGE